MNEDFHNSREDDFFLTDMFDRAIRNWWLVAVCMIIGGLAGLLAASLFKPVYESTSVITTVIDYAYSGNLTAYEEDHLLTAIGDIIQSDEVMDHVIAEGVKTGLASDADQMRSSLFASRQGFRWELSSRFPDPQIAETVNRLWLETAIGELEEFRLNSILSLAEFNTQVGIENCFQQAVIVEPVSAYCDAAEFQALRDQIRSLETNGVKKSLLSRLLASRISFQVTQEPDLPVKPVHLGWNISVFAGVILGLLVAIALLIFGVPTRRKTDH